MCRVSLNSQNKTVLSQKKNIVNPTEEGCLISHLFTLILQELLVLSLAAQALVDFYALVG